MAVSILVIGAGSRGTIYAEHARQNGATIAGVAEPRDHYRERMARAHAVAPQAVVGDWRELAERPRLADAVVIATGDRDHVEPALAFARRGYHILLEKPMAPSAEECRRIVTAVKEAGVLFAVCHVLRYTLYTERLKGIVDSGILGSIASVHHLEPVGYWHQAHSFVRGNWRNQAESSPMLLAKSCHDLDWIRYILGERCTRISSFGSLRHFHSGNRPPDAADRCLDCAIERTCPYSAVQIYLERVRRGETHWPVDVLSSDVTEAGITEALRTGPYGRCVYACDNDVVDHQVVNMEFASGATASFTMTGFTRQRDRETRIFGTRGELFGNGQSIEVHDFLTDQTQTIDVNAESDGSIRSGHGGGDERLIRHFVAAVAQGDASRIKSGYDDTLETHLMVFAAETARREGRVVDIELDEAPS